MKLLDHSDQQLIEEQLRARLEHVLAAPSILPLQSAIHQFVIAGGKRLRPQLCAWTYLHASQIAHVKQIEPAMQRALLDLAAGWELFHAFLLVHDDIIDEAASRRGRPSLHRLLASLDGGSLQFGTNLAIVAGDLLYSGAMRLWHEMEVPGGIFKRELQLLSRVACTTGLGQAIDICQSHAAGCDDDQDALLLEYQWKTAAYTFEGPMLSAAILARLDDPALAAISSYALSLGKAYQLQNDLLDLEKPADTGCDLVQGKRTVTLLRARALMGTAQRESFDQRLELARSGDDRAVEIADALRLELRACGAVQQTQELIDDLIGEALLAAAQPALPPPLSAAMASMIRALQDAYFRSPLEIAR